MIEQTSTFPVTRKQAFAFFTDVTGWEAWTPFSVRTDDPRFVEPGDRISLLYQSLKIPLAASATIDELVADQSLQVSFRMASTLPVILRLELHGAGTSAVVVRATIDFSIPGGQLARRLWGLSMVPVVVRRDLNRSLDRAHDLLAAGVIGDG
jgi:hypothetical protein